jgi:hypothetical protein
MPRRWERPARRQASRGASRVSGRAASRPRRPRGEAKSIASCVRSSVSSWRSPSRRGRGACSPGDRVRKAASKAAQRASEGLSAGRDWRRPRSALARCVRRTRLARRPACALLRQAACCRPAVVRAGSRHSPRVSALRVGWPPAALAWRIQRCWRAHARWMRLRRRRLRASGGWVQRGRALSAKALGFQGAQQTRACGSGSGSAPRFRRVFDSTRCADRVPPAPAPPCAPGCTCAG